MATSTCTPDPTAHRLAYALAVGTALFLVGGIGALGIVGEEGDRADLLYLGALALGVVGAALARLRPRGMAWAMYAAAAATLLAGVIALLLGKHEAEVSSVPEIMGLSAMYAALFASSGWLFRRCVD